MKGIMIVIVVVLVVGLIGFATNPDYDDYKEWYKSKTTQDVEASTDLGKSVVGMVSGLVADASIVREDYKVYSLYTSEVLENYRVLGIFNNFFVLGDGSAKAAE
ncbi:MAG TPA: hypothetical protein PLL21_06455 [Sedimentibacter sp.]|nr:hypothetical protein [Sedimentibacter sp.]HOH69572.1 hypothetical protein [Sedimentibacter sp.]HPX00518.1 hypothetical protein [Sedimentibacter sp.]HQB64008.1 hypothetical protein [Sedimentibacter sp.]